MEQQWIEYNKSSFTIAYSVQYTKGTLYCFVTGCTVHKGNLVLLCYRVYSRNVGDLVNKNIYLELQVI